MKLNRILASVTVASTLLSAGAMAADGTITFNGTVTASACTALTGVSVGGGAPAVNQTINLPAVPAPALNVAAGTYLGQTAFKISLTGCASVGALSNVRAIFDTPFAPATDAYVAGNTAPSGAADVAVAILTPAGAQIDMNGGTAVAPGYTLPSTAGAIDMDFVAAYKSLSTSVTAGPVTAQKSMSIIPLLSTPVVTVQLKHRRPHFPCMTLSARQASMPVMSRTPPLPEPGQTLPVLLPAR